MPRPEGTHRDISRSVMENECQTLPPRWGLGILFDLFQGWREDAHPLATIWLPLRGICFLPILIFKDHQRVAIDSIHPEHSK